MGPKAGAELGRKCRCTSHEAQEHENSRSSKHGGFTDCIDSEAECADKEKDPGLVRNTSGYEVASRFLRLGSFARCSQTPERLLAGAERGSRT